MKGHELDYSDQLTDCQILKTSYFRESKRNTSYQLLSGIAYT
jgi:hypothetical protein